MKHLLGISTVLLLTAINAFSQAVFKDGYIIKNNNDTVFGLIEYKGNKTNSLDCTFKKNIESASQKYTPNDIKAYRFDNSKYYVSKVVTLGDKEELLFLEYLINGRVDVYYYFDGQAEHYFIDGGDNQLFELKEGSPEIITSHGKRLIRQSKQYLGILKYVFRESPAISKQAETVQLNRKSLIDIAHSYHNEICANEECIIYEKKDPHENIKFGLLAGLGGVTVSLADNIPTKMIYFRNSDFGLTLCPFVGFFVKANIPAIDAHLFFQYQGTLGSWNLKTSNSYVDVNKLNYLSEISIRQTFLGNKGVFKYEFNEGKNIRPNIHAGVYFNYSFNLRYSCKYEIRLSSGDLYSEGEGADYYNPFSAINYGPVAGFGFVVDTPNKKAILLDIQYQREYGLWECLNVNNFSLNVGYQF
jgi:hypothetical protein